MAKKLSQALNISTIALIKEGALDCFENIDSLFYIDPKLLEETSIPELANSYKKLENYFANILKLLEASEYKNDRFWREAYKKLILKEIQNTGLGYSKHGKSGSAIGPKIAGVLVETSDKIIKAGIKDPSFFELVGLFEENIGADRISDIITSIIVEDLLNFTVRVTENLAINSKGQIKYKNKIYSVPKTKNSKKSIILVPYEILTPLPVAYDWDDIDIVCTHNEELRKLTNKIIGTTWKDATNRNIIKKKELKSILLKDPVLLKELIEAYKSKKPKKYDFTNDPLGEFIWYDEGIKYSKQFPISLIEFSPINHENIFDVVTKICEKFSDLVENNGLFKLFYDDNKKLRNERFAQLLFYAIADSYCESNNLSLNREPNAGRGPVDFKISSGYTAIVNVEIKYSTNNQLLHGFKKQLPIYNKAEKTKQSIYLIILTSNNTKNVEDLYKLRNQAIDNNQRVPKVILADDRHKKSASKA